MPFAQSLTMEQQEEKRGGRSRNWPREQRIYPGRAVRSSDVSMATSFRSWFLKNLPGLITSRAGDGAYNTTEMSRHAVRDWSMRERIGRGCSMHLHPIAAAGSAKGRFRSGWANDCIIVSWPHLVVVSYGIRNEDPR
jgi:hypothetical protein